MKLLPTRMTASELSLVLNISEETIKKLEKAKEIPSFIIKKRKYYNFQKVLKHFKKLEGGIA